MDQTKQGQILAQLLHADLIEHQVVVDWVDEIIAKSDKPDYWLIEISLSKKENVEDVVSKLWSEFGYEFNWPFSEHVAIITYLYKVKGLPIHHCLIHLDLISDDFKTSENDNESNLYKEKVSRLFEMIDVLDCDEGLIEKATKETKDLAKESQAKHRDVIEYINKLT